LSGNGITIQPKISGDGRARLCRMQRISRRTFVCRYNQGKRTIDCRHDVQFLIGNNDAHGKNFSIIHENIIKLAPFYDLVSTQVYPGLDRKLAMAIGKTYRHDHVNGASFTQFSRDIKMRPEKVFEIIEGSARAVGEKYEHVLSAHEKQYGESKIYADLHKVIQKNHAHLQKLINEKILGSMRDNTA